MQQQPFAPLDGRVYPRFSGIRTFFRLPALLSQDEIGDADVAIMGVPFDGGTSYRPGARFAPEHVRSLSTMGRGYQPAHDVHVFRALKVGDAGDVPVVPQDIAKTHANIHQAARRLLDANVIPVFVGGDHSICIGTLQAAYEKHGPVGVVHFDAHTDAYPAAWGCDVHHGSFMRIAHERGWIRGDRVVQIGIRGPFAAKDDVSTPEQMGFHVVTVDDVRLRGLDRIKVQFEALADVPVYVTFDVDCLDPAFAPGTGTPVPGGLTTWEAQQMLRALAGLQIVGADVVEVAPAYDHGEITSLVAVSVLMEYLALIASKKTS